MEDIKVLSKISHSGVVKKLSPISSPICEECPNCKKLIPKGNEFCPNCGYKLVSYCTFCGCPMDKTDEVCPDCGQPAKGIICPDCGTLNHRSFCRSCNAPLTKAAVKAIERAKADPLFIKCKELCEKAAGLESTLELNTETSESIPEGKLEFLKLVGMAPKQNNNAPEKGDIAKAKAEYESIISDINALFAQMLPPVGSTPQEQRNYYSARKVAVTKKVVSHRAIGWVCNFCGYTHPFPSDCSKPGLGGKWIYQEIDNYVKEYKYEE